WLLRYRDGRVAKMVGTLLNGQVGRFLPLDEKISPFFCAGTLLRQDLQLDQLPARKRLKLQHFFPRIVGGGREPPNKVDKRPLLSGRLHPEPLVPVPACSPLQVRRHIQFAPQALAICGSAVDRTAQSLPTQSDRSEHARHVPTESLLPVENVLDFH